MQWSAGKGAGFTDGTQWLALNPNYTQINVEEQAERPDSVLSYYKKLLALKKSPEYKETFTYGYTYIYFPLMKSRTVSSLITGFQVRTQFRTSLLLQITGQSRVC